MQCFFLTGNATRRLEEVIGVEDVATIARDHLTTWELLRPYLGLSRQQEEVIRNTYHHYGKQKQECLEVWKEVKGNEATYGALITAAEKARDQQLADRVKAMLGTSVTIGATHSEQCVQSCTCMNTSCSEFL